MKITDSTGREQEVEPYEGEGPPMVVEHEPAKLDQAEALFRKHHTLTGAELCEALGWRFGAVIFQLRRVRGLRIVTRRAIINRKTFYYTLEP